MGTPSSLIKRMDSVLLDTSAIFALLNPQDDHHDKAVAINRILIVRQVALVLPNFLLAESHTIIHRRLGAKSARQFLNAALQEFDIERVMPEDEWSAHALLQETSRLSYFDAVAIALADRLGIKEVFTFDRHFASRGLRLAIA